ncbi:MAG: adenylosuccinate synthase [Eubacteriales bacterium]
MVKAIVGANWGDEGKGKITDLFSATSDVVVRFQGGANAGHTIINHYGKFALHTLPSGVFNEHILNVIGSGVALDIVKLIAELEGVVARGVPTPKLLVSDRAQVLMPYHVLQDTYEEERLSDKAFGSTKSGIGPFYSDKYGKIGIQVCELFDDVILMERIEKACALKNPLFVHLYEKPPLDPQELLAEMVRQRNLIAPYVGDVYTELQKAIKEDKTILLEGQLGTLKDPDFGIYPMVTSSHTVAAFACISAGIPPHKVTDIVAITKAYSSAVGGGEFISEIFGEEAEELRRRGGDAGEYGATTGRPRRVGWFDTVASGYGARMQGATEVVLTCLDVLGYLEEIKICVGYEIDGVVTKDFPTTPKLAKAKPVIHTLPGWNCDVRGVTTYDDLPPNAKGYIDFLEAEMGIPITMVSTGPKRDEITNRTPKI